MLEFDYNSFDSIVVLPPRSELYCIPIEGIGTPDQEALLDYVHRLALAHGIRVAHLFTEIVLPKASIGKKWRTGCFSRQFPRTMNGYTQFAIEMADVVSGLTKAPGLRDGTFIHWQPLFDPSGSGLLHPKRRWCPECIAGDLSDGRLPIFKLLWTSSCVTHCQHHGIQLISRCLSCGQDQRFASESHAHGRCETCGGSLGWQAGLSGAPALRLGSREHFNVHAVASMIAIGEEKVQWLARPEILSATLKSIVLSEAGGSIYRLAKAIGIGHMALTKWIGQSARPRFSAFIEVCYRLGKCPVQLLEDAHSTQISLFPHELLPLRKMSQKLTQAELCLIERDIRATIEAEGAPYRNAAAFAAKHNTSAKYLRRRLPVAYLQLMDHLRRIRAQRAEARMANLEATARRVASELHRCQRKNTEFEISEALRANQISLGCPRTRRAFKDELKRLRAYEARGPVDG
jgi:hypothetical protein